LRQSECQTQSLSCALTCNVSDVPTEVHLPRSHLHIINIIVKYRNCQTFCLEKNKEVLPLRVASHPLFSPLHMGWLNRFNVLRQKATPRWVLSHTYPGQTVVVPQSHYATAKVDGIKIIL
jgi:hypothetical protein